MNEIALTLVLLSPFIAIAVLLATSMRWSLALAAVPAFAAALLTPVGSTLELSWLLLGVHFALDATGQLFLLFSSLVWLVAGVYAAATPPDPGRRRGFDLFFLLALAGNLILVLAADMVTFYVGFALMGLSAYGMVIGRRSQRARRAGRIYLAFTLAGELALFSGLLALAAAVDSRLFADLTGIAMPPVAVGLLLLGFGIKLALPGLHLWLVPTYTGAPIVAVAVLSGPMMNAGLLGWLRFLPSDASGLADWGSVLMLLGTAGLVLGVWLGVMQREPRAVLAYSSIAKMGLISALFGAALANPVHTAPIIAALVLFAMHHLLVKSALFLGVGEWEKRGRVSWVMVVLGLLALTMIGAPFTGGAFAKQGLGEAVADGLDGPAALLTLAAIGTALLMARFMWLLTRPAARPSPICRVPVVAWLALLPVALWAPSMPGAIAFDVAGLVPLGAILAALAVMAWMDARWPGLWPHGRSSDELNAIGLALRHAKRHLPALEFQSARLRVALAWPASAPAPSQGTLVIPGLLWLALFLGLLMAAVLSH